MSTFDDASLVFIPSGYKTSKAYSVKPIDGTGDLTFTRSNDTATRVGPNGLIEKVRTNLLLHSQAFDNAGWVKVTGGTATAPVVTANAAVAPDGTTTADRIQFSVTGTTGSDFSIIRQGVAGLTGSTTYAFSVYLRSNTGASQDIILYDQNSGTTLTASVTTTWQRFTFNRTTGAGTTTFIPSIAVIGNINSGDKDILAWGAQLEYSDFGATDYIATTSAAVSVGPVANVPRLDYLNSSCPRLLLEPQRTNLALYSEQIDNSYWPKSNITVTANYDTSPDGYQNADRVVSAGGSFPQIGRSFTGLTIGTAYSISFYVKSDGTTQAVQSFQVTGFTRTDFTPSNTWQRITYTFTATATSHTFVLFRNSGTAAAFSYLCWGIQWEAGAYATSYIPTLGAAVTRGADVASKTGISSLIGQTQGTLFLDFVYTHNNTALAEITSLSDGTSANRAYIGTIFSTVLSVTVDVSNAQQFGANTPYSLVIGQRYKAALAYKANDFAFYVNGVQIATDNSGSVPAMSAIQTNSGAGSSLFYHDVKQTLLFKTRLSNSDLAALTTL